MSAGEVWDICAGAMLRKGRSIKGQSVEEAADQCEVSEDRYLKYECGSLPIPLRLHGLDLGFCPTDVTYATDQALDHLSTVLNHTCGDDFSWDWVQVAERLGKGAVTGFFRFWVAL